MRYFCTYFDAGYLVKGLALYRSLVRHSTPFRLWVLCFDDLTYKTLKSLKLDEVVPISLKDFEAGDEELLQTKATRSRIEYYFTCTPSLPLYVLKNYPHVDLITYVDADLFFFSDPSPIYEELANNSILIIGHRFPPNLKHLEVTGIYNVGLLSFRNDDIALQCLNWWRKLCLEWCYDSTEGGKYADQKYLDDWPSRFPCVTVLKNKGAGLAPWNITNYHLALKNKRVFVDLKPLIFFHFQGFNQITKWLYRPNLARYGVKTNSILKDKIYRLYLGELFKIIHDISVMRDMGEQRINMNSIRHTSTPTRKRHNVIYEKIKKVKQTFNMIKDALEEGDLWVTINGKIINK